MTRGKSVFDSMNYGILCFLILSTTLISGLNGQYSREVDSLRSIVGTVSASEKITVLKSLSQNYAYINMDTAKKYLDTLTAYADEIKDTKGQTIAALLRGNFLYDVGDYAQAQHYNKKALDLSLSSSDTTIMARAYLNLGSTADAAGLKDSAIVNYVQAVEMFQSISDSINAAYVYINIGLVFKSLKNYDKALYYYHTAYQDLVALGDDFGQTTIATNLGSLYMDLNDLDSARLYAQKGYDGYKSMGYHVYTVYPLEVLAQAYAGLGAYDLAEKLFAEGLQIATSNKMEEESFTLCIGMARVLLTQEKMEEAIDYGSRCLQKAQQTQSLEDLADANQFMYLTLKKAGSTDQALQYLETFRTYKDSLDNTEKVEAIAEIETKYQTAQKEQEIANQKLELAIKESELGAKRIQIIGLVAGMIIIMLSALMYYNHHKAKQRQILQAAVLSEKERGFESVITATEEERQRISKDLHDGIGQQLSALKMALANVSSKISDEDQREDLELITEQFSKSADEVRQISHQMMPRTLLENGLVEAMDDLLKSSFQFSKISYSFEHHKVSERFSQRIEISLYRVLQELVNNIIKHSEATEVSVQLIRNKNKLVLFVEDNGKGIKEEAGKGHGLLNIKSRLDMVKGSVNYEPSMSSGTSATISIPLV
ncbi:MAG: sensor histidine kinase [Cyclobacteriaceae bacterium]